jgi:hypothetical protein
MSCEKTYTKLLIVAVIFLVISAIFAAQRFYKQKQHPPPPDNTHIHLILKQIENLEQTTEGQALETQWAYWGNDSLHGFELQRLSSEARLYFYFSQKVCPPCILETVDLIKKYVSDYEQNDTIVFISPDWQQRLRNDCYGKRLLTLQRGTLDIALEEEDAPFFFRISENMELTSVHIVTKVDFVRTEEYLRASLNVKMP